MIRIGYINRRGAGCSYTFNDAAAAQLKIESLFRQRIEARARCDAYEEPCGGVERCPEGKWVWWFDPEAK